MTHPIRILAMLLALAFCTAMPASARAAADPAPSAQASDAARAPGTVGDEPEEAEDGGMRLSSAVEIGLVLTILTIIPALVISLTCFTRIVIVLSFVRRALAIQELPPDPVLIGLALFLTTFVMGPVFLDVYDEAYVPYKSGEMAFEEAGTTAWGEIRGFLLENTREAELDLFVQMADIEPPEEAPDARLTADDLPFRVVIPAFVLSELKTAFQMGFLLFLPFLVIDLVIASVLISMGMFMLPPAMISTPFKILLFVLVDGWRLVCESLVTSFVL